MQRWGLHRQRSRDQPAVSAVMFYAVVFVCVCDILSVSTHDILILLQYDNGLTIIATIVCIVLLEILLDDSPLY